MTFFTHCECCYTAGDSQSSNNNIYARLAAIGDTSPIYSTRPTRHQCSSAAELPKRYSVPILAVEAMINDFSAFTYAKDFSIRIRKMVFRNIGGEA